MDSSARVIFVGGGLANGLAAYRLHQRRPDIEWLILERGDRLGGDHTWSCHDHDLSKDSRSWMGTLITKEWPRHEVRFPQARRVFESSYLSIRSETFNRSLQTAFANRIQLRTEVARIEPRRVILSTGESLDCTLVVDGRGLDPKHPPRGVGFQKFRGLFVTTKTPHGIQHPIIMDATVSQIGGYRFLYVLPWTDTDLLVEDTYYDEAMSLPGADKDPGIVDYLNQLGISDVTVTGIENGILPIPLHGAKRPQGISQVVTSGLAAGLFHPTTGYSLPDAIRFAEWLANEPELTSAALAQNAARRADDHWNRGGFYRRLNNMLFRAIAPSDRYKILAKFYEHDSGLIARFYAGELHTLDPLRILRRKPQIKLTAALRAFFTRVAYDT